MSKKLIIFLIASLVTMVGAIGALTVYTEENSKSQFASDGYILSSDGVEVSQLTFNPNSEYSISRIGNVVVENSDGGTTRISDDAFVHLNDGSIVALRDGVLLDFNDLSDNFINNYYITRELPIYESGNEYVIETSSGDVNFGEHVWKLTNSKYLIRANSLNIHFAEDDVRSVGSFVEVAVSDDGIVKLVTESDVFSTISEECYIETENGVRFYPVNLLVDSGQYKIGLSNLVINPDDSIILTEAETRRQIVPELNLEAVDGEDGEDGEAGLQGEIGQAGEIGETGETGEKGEIGENGDIGEEGNSGSSGDTGDTGSDGDDGKQGDAGDAGAAGKKGSVGSTGAQGTSVNVSGSTNVALPALTLTNWEIGSTSVRGTITVSGEVGRLTTSEKARVYLIAEDGTEIPCFELGNPTEIPTLGISEEFDNFAVGDTEIYFATFPDVLKPDTKYTLSVVVPYTADEVSQSVYYREFISRTFVTDGSGVVLSENEVNENSLKLNVKTSEPENIESLKIYMLTADQNKTFTMNSTDYLEEVTISKDGTVNYKFDKNNNHKIQIRAVNAFNNPFSLDFEHKLETLSELTPDTTYYFRMVTETKNTLTNIILESLSDHAVDLTTLKSKATVVGQSDSGAPLELGVIYNRYTGNVEVSRPVVKDPNNGVERYEYYCYEVDPTTNQKILPAIAVKTALPTDPYEVPFVLDSNKEYVFEVIMVFHDNKNTVEEIIGNTRAPFSISGDMLPTLTLDKAAVTYSSFDGTITMVLNGNSSLEIEKSKALEVEIYADNLKDTKLSFDTMPDGINPVAAEDSLYEHKLELSKISENTYKIDLDLQKLKKQTNYVIRLRGYLDLHEDQTDDLVTVSTIGSVSFRTDIASPITANWKVDNDSLLGQINRTLKLQFVEANQDLTLEKLKAGRVEIGLYVGTSGQESVGAKHIITGSDNIAKLFDGTGYNITEANFGVSASSGDESSYMLKIETVVDETYKNEDQLGYVNDFADIDNRTTNITVTPKAPDLPTRPHEALTVTPIYNEDAVVYGADVDADLPDDAVIGYTLQAEYNNSNRFAKSVTYYAFEYKSFYNAILNRQDPVKTADSQQFSVSISEVFGDTVSPATILFDRTKGFDTSSGVEAIKDDAGKILYYNNTILDRKIYQFEPDLSSFKLDRGYKYVFAYTVEYEIKGAAGAPSVVSSYPYGSDKYEDAKETYGVGTHLNVELGKGDAYVLNSGIISAPQVAPQIFYFLNKVEYDNNSATSGKAEIHYKYINNAADKTVKDTGADITQIEFENSVGSMESVDINATTGYDDINNKWYSLTIPFKLNNTEDDILLEPIIKLDTYKIDYTEIIDRLTEGATEEISDAELDELYSITYLAKVPVEPGYGNMLNDNNYFTVNPVIRSADNEIILNIARTSTNQHLFPVLKDRAFLLKVTADDSNGNQKTVYLPIKEGGATSSQTHAVLPTGEISEFLGFKENSTTEYKDEFELSYSIIFDSGEQGFFYLENSAEFGMQIVGQSAGTDHNGESILGFNMGEYIAINDTLAPNAPTNALAHHVEGLDAFKVESLYNSYYSEDNLKTRLTYQHYYLSTNSNADAKYLTVTENGVDFSFSAGMEFIDNSYRIPKVASVSTTTDIGEIDPALVGSIIPTLNIPTLVREVSLNSVSVDSFQVSAADQIIEFHTDAKPIIHVAIIDKTALGNNTINVNDIEATIGYKDKIEVYGELDGEKKPTGYFRTIDGEDIVTGLARDENYLMVFYAELASGINILKESSANNDAILGFKTLGKIGLAVSEFDGYINNNYFNKYSEVIFTLENSRDDIEIRYDIFSTDGSTDASGNLIAIGNPIASSDTVTVTNGALDIFDYLTVPKANGEPSYDSSNSVTLDLEPGTKLRDKIKPGFSYVFRISALSTSAGAGNSEVEVVEETISIPPESDTASLIYTTKSTNNSVEFTATIIDSNYVLMGKKNDTNDASNPQTGIYGVRFTYFLDDGTEKLMQTVYNDGPDDDSNTPDFYYTSDIKQKFTLNAANLAGNDKLNEYGSDENIKIFKPGRKFKMYVYAVDDANNDGKSLDYSNLDGEQSYTYLELFGSGSGSLDQTSVKFGELINSFWSSKGTILSDLTKFEESFRIADKIGQSTDKNGILINDSPSFITARRDNLSRFEIRFRESFGFIGDGNVQAFEYVDWEVIGASTSGQVTKINGTRLHKDSFGDLFISKVDSVGYDVYAITIPVVNLPRGEYTITLEMKDSINNIYRVSTFITE